MPASAGFCPSCGRSMRLLPTAERTAATVAYLTLLPAAVLLFLPAFRNSRYVRFHAWQSILLWGTFAIASVVAIYISDMAGAVVFLLLGVIAFLGMVFLWAVLSVKAWQGEQFELPVFGELAARLR